MPDMRAGYGEKLQKYPSMAALMPYVTGHSVALRGRSRSHNLPSDYWCEMGIEESRGREKLQKKTVIYDVAAVYDGG